MSEGSIALHIYRHPTSIQPLKKTFPLQNILNKTHYLNQTDSEIHLNFVLTHSNKNWIQHSNVNFLIKKYNISLQACMFST